MNKELLKKELLRLIGECMEKYGFKTRGTGALVRKFHQGSQLIQLAPINHADDFDVVIHFAVRFDEAQAFLDKHNSMLTEKQKKRSFTFGCELGNYFGEGQKRWSVFSPDDVSEIVPGICANLVEHVIPFLDCYRDAQCAMDLLCGDRGFIFVPSPDLRAARIIALASVIDDVDVNNVLRNQKEFMRTITRKEAQQGFQRYLANMWMA